MSIPDSGDGSGIDSVPASNACPNEELERTPPSLRLPASPMSTKINLRQGTLVNSTGIYTMWSCCLPVMCITNGYITKLWSESLYN